MSWTWRLSIHMRVGKIKSNEKAFKLSSSYICPPLDVSNVQIIDGTFLVYLLNCIWDIFCIWKQLMTFFPFHYFLYRNPWYSCLDPGQSDYWTSVFHCGKLNDVNYLLQTDLKWWNLKLIYLILRAIHGGIHHKHLIIFTFIAYWGRQYIIALLKWILKVNLT